MSDFDVMLSTAPTRLVALQTFVRIVVGLARASS